MNFDTNPSKSINKSKILIQAVKKGNVALVRKLLSCGVSQNIRDHMGCSPLYHAARYNRVEILKMLLENNSSVNVATKMNRTPLQIAASYGHTDIVRILVANGADVNSVDPFGMSALHWATENNFIEIVKILLKAGADRTLLNKFGKTAQSLAFANSHFEVCRLLQEEPDSDISASEYLLKLRNNIHFESGDSFIASEPDSTLSKISVISRNLQNEFRDQVKLKIDSTLSDKKDETLKLFEKHGIRLLPEDQSTVIANALKHGKIAVLTEAGKLALKKTKPYIIRKIANMSNPSQVSTLNKKICENSLNGCEESKQAPKRKMFDDDCDKTKVVKMEVKLPSTLAAEKNHIINCPDVDSSASTVTKTDNESFSSNVETFSNIKRDLVVNLKPEVHENLLLIKKLKTQVLMALRIAEHFKIKYEAKEREAALYKTQLINLTKFVSKSAISRISELHNM